MKRSGSQEAIFMGISEEYFSERRDHETIYFRSDSGSDQQRRVGFADLLGCIDRLCEHKIGYPYLSCRSGPGYCTAGGGECLTLSPENEEPWLIADWELAGVEITVDALASMNVATNDAPRTNDAGNSSVATHFPSAQTIE